MILLATTQWCYGVRPRAYATKVAAVLRVVVGLIVVFFDSDVLRAYGSVREQHSFDLNFDAVADVAAVTPFELRIVIRSNRPAIDAE